VRSQARPWSAATATAPATAGFHARSTGRDPLTQSALPSSDASPTLFDPTELGNADRFLEKYGSYVLYDVDREGWLVWDARRWVADDTGEVYRWMEECVDSIAIEAEAAEGHQRKQLTSWSRTSASNARIRASLEVARNRLGVPVRAADLDRHPWKLTCWSGTVDLKTGTLGTPDREDMITTLCPEAFKPTAEAAPCPRWVEFLGTVMNGDLQMVDFIQRALGYSITGSTREQVFFILYGTGRNGKSTFLNAVRSVLGDNARNVEASSFLKQETTRVRQDLASLRGARVVTTSEIEDGQQLDEDLIKRITGGDPITARWLYARREVEFIPTLKLWMAVNHKPRIWGADEGIWRRVVMIPWEVQIPEDKVDKDFAEKLTSEREGILAWMIHGCREYLRLGLSPPIKVTAATKDYRAESDRLGDFLTDCTLSADTESVSVGELYRCYQNWSRDLGEKAVSARSFSIRLKERGFSQSRTKTARYWAKIRMTEDGSKLAASRPLHEEWGTSYR
jgi:putative DNA primase/helicase